MYYVLGRTNAKTNVFFFVGHSYFNFNIPLKCNSSHLDSSGASARGLLPQTGRLITCTQYTWKFERNSGQIMNNKWHFTWSFQILTSTWALISFSDGKFPLKRSNKTNNLNYKITEVTIYTPRSLCFFDNNSKETKAKRRRRRSRNASKCFKL